MREGFKIIDADRHVIEPLELWREYLEPQWRAQAPYYAEIKDEPLEERLARLGPKGLMPIPPMAMLDGKPLYDKLTEQAWVEMCTTSYLRMGQFEFLHDPKTYVADMDDTGVDVAFLFPSYALLLEGFAPLEPARASAFARAYNTWLRDFCRIAPERLRGVAVISLHDPPGMVPELERVLGFGWKAVVLRPNPVNGRRLSDPAYEPFWTACERHSVAVSIHDGTHTYLPSAGADRFDTRFALRACSHPMEQMMALLTLIEGGVLERHPGLRVALLEAGCGWIPYWLWRLDELAYRFMAGEVASNVRMKPSAYFHRQCFASLEPGEPYLSEVLRHTGTDTLLFGTDFPHSDHDLDMLKDVLALRSQIPEEALRKILWDNPARFFGLE